MSTKDIIRAWKDEAFRESLGETILPENPAGRIELSDELLDEVQGGVKPLPTGVDCITDILGYCSGYCPTSQGC